MSLDTDAINRFHALYYDSLVWDRNTKWRGVRTEKCPLDLWIYQEIIYETRPDLIIETGTLEGGSALFMATVCDMIGNGRVLSIDLHSNEASLPYHDRVRYLWGDSLSDIVLNEIKIRVQHLTDVMVILDSNHSYSHVLLELEHYSKFVTPGSYLIVEDTNINGHPVLPGFGPGPMEAVQDFLAQHREFDIDRSREKFLMTFNPHGYLRRIA